MPAYARKPLRSILAVAVMSSGAFLAQTAAAPVAQATAPAFSSITCDGPARFFQLRGGNVTDGYMELWMSSVVDPAGTAPDYYAWQRAVEFSSPLLAVASREQVKNADGTWSSYIYYTTKAGDLRELKYTPGVGHTSRLIGTGDYAFSRLAWDGNRLWGIKGGHLYVVRGVANNWTESTGVSVVSENFGWPRSFFGVGNSDFEIAWGDSNGTLRYVDATISTSGNSVDSQTVAATGWTGYAIASPGAGLIYRYAGADVDQLRRQTIGALNGLNTEFGTSDLVAADAHPANERITTVPDACTKKPVVPTTDDASIRDAMMTRAEKWITDDVGYSQSSFHQGYRTDCSGYVSMAWQLKDSSGDPLSLSTSTLSQRSTPISKSQLQRGDILNNAGDHVVLFDKWANADKTEYYAYEESPGSGYEIRGGAGAKYAKIPYPYYSSQDQNYVPRRLNSLM